MRTVNTQELSWLTSNLHLTRKKCKHTQEMGSCLWPLLHPIPYVLPCTMMYTPTSLPWRFTLFISSVPFVWATIPGCVHCWTCVWGRVMLEMNGHVSYVVQFSAEPRNSDSKLGVLSGASDLVFSHTVFLSFTQSSYWPLLMTLWMSLLLDGITNSPWIHDFIPSLYTHTHVCVCVHV